MKKKIIKNFAFYCSGKATRVIKFYNNKYNYNKFKPKGIFYDGNDSCVLNKLQKLFPQIVKNLDINKLDKNEFKKINSTTSKKLHSFMDDIKADYLFCFGNKILKKSFIVKYNKRIINFHPSLLPSFKGLNAIDKALLKNVSFIGNSAHYINENIDDGEIIIQSSMFRSDFEDYEDLLELQFPMLKIILRDILNYSILDKNIFDDLKNRKKQFFIPKKV